nr:MAG TPA: hypothetical protein [Caudoviricetes sp.]
MSIHLTPFCKRFCTSALHSYYKPFGLICQPFILTFWIIF